jgi:dolichol-phosphate mannosyltransferase
MTAIGLAVSLLAFGFAVAIVFVKLFYGIDVRGWAAVMISILTLGGLNLVMLGLVGEYVWRGLRETRGRPSYVVDRVIEEAAGPAPPSDVPRA